MLKEFKEFISKGNLVEIAVGLILALAFAGLVASFTENLINPIIGAIFGQPNFDSLVIDIGDAQLRYGAFLDHADQLRDRGVRAVPGGQGLQPDGPQGGRGGWPDGDRAADRDPGRAAEALNLVRGVNSGAPGTDTEVCRSTRPPTP